MNTEKVSYLSKDGVNLSGIINAPKNRDIKGCIVLCHGLCGTKDEWQNWFVHLSEKLCKEGFRVVRFDFRGHGHSGLNSEDMTIAGELMDLEATIDEYTKDFEQIGLLGYSFGTQASVLYTTKNPQKVKTLVLWAPVLDFKEGFINNPEYNWGKMFLKKGGYETLEKQGYITLDINNFKLGRNLFAEFDTYKPYEKLSVVKCPVLTIHGKQDRDVVFSFSEKYGKPNEDSRFVPVNADHSLLFARKKVLTETVEWYNNHN
ncbi:MAG: alpha/beta hydrolase family protein [Deltaproteobacteria bacterium]